MGTWDDLYSAGERLGFKKGGRVKKDTSSEFVMKTGAQDSMDHGVQPARKGTTQQDIEAGGTPRLKPKFKKGGRAAKKGKEKMAEKGKKELKKILGGQYTEKEAEAMKKKGRRRGRPGQKGAGKKGYQTGGAVKVHNSTPLIGS